MRDVTFAFMLNEDGTWSWMWEDPDDVCWIGTAETAEQAERQAKQTAQEWYDRTH